MTTPNEARLLRLLESACAMLDMQAATARHYANAGLNKTANLGLAEEIQRNTANLREAAKI